MVFLAISTFVIAVLLYLLIKSTKNKNLPPGPIRWPLVGNMPEIAFLNAKYPHLAMETLAEKYGDVMRLGFGVHEACIVSSYEAIKEIFPKDEASERFTFQFVTDRSFHQTLGIIWSKGSMWSKMRAFTVKGLREFGFGKQKSMDVLMQEEIADLVSFIKDTTEKNNGEWKVDSHHFAGSIINIIWSMVAGRRFPIGDPTVKTILGHGNKMSEIVGAGNVYNALPFLRVLFPKWTNYDKHVVCHKEYQEFVKGMIKKSVELRTERPDTEPENFIEVFLDEIEKNKDDPNTIFTEKQLIVVLKDLFLSGSETTGTAMTWCILYLALYPNVQQKIKDELNKVVGSGPINIADFQRMPYLKAVILEILRASNFVPIGPPRTAVNDIPCRDFKIPKGSIVMMNVGPILKDEVYWKDPQVFRPERFLDESETTVINSERITAIFGMGKRACLGETFVWNSLPMYLATFVRTFNMETVPGREPTTVNPQVGCALIPQAYSVKLSWD